MFMKGEHSQNPFQEPDLKTSPFTLALALAVMVGCQVESPLSGDPAAHLDSEFDQLRSDYLADYWQHHPVQAASAGLTVFHGRLPAMTAADISHQIDQIETSLNDLASLPVQQISNPVRQNEWYRLRSHARERLLNLRELKQWQRDPGLYVPASAFEVLLDPATGSALERAGWLLARLHQLPILLEAGRANLIAPPQRFTLDAIHRTDQLIELFDQALPELATDTPDLLDELVSAGELAASELLAFSRYLREQVLPTSIQSAAIGRDLYQRYLTEVHEIQYPPEAIIASARHRFADIERELAMLATDKGHGPDWANLLDLLAENPPTRPDQIALHEQLTVLADELLLTARVMLDARIHTGQISVDEARHFLSDNLHMAHERTAIEVRRLLDHPGHVFRDSSPVSTRAGNRLMAEVN